MSYLKFIDFLISIGLSKLDTEMDIVENCENESCIDDIDQIEAEIAKCMATYQEKKQQYQDALIDNLKKDLILHKILNRETENNFDEFDDRFPTDTLNKLRSIDKTEKCDSSFILTALRGLYIHDLAALKNKTYSGISKTTSKEPITPKKMEYLKEIFEKRLGYIQEDCVVNDERKKKFPKHVKNAIESINKAKK